MQDTEFKYFQFPLFLLQDLMHNKTKALNNIIRFGIYRFSKTIAYNEKQVIDQVIYGIHRGGLTSELKRITDNYQESDKLSLDEDYNGFQGANFDPEYENEQLSPLFNSEQDFQEYAIQYYQIKQAYKTLGIEGNYDNCIDNAQEIENSIPEREPMPMVNKGLVFDFRDNDKTEFELMQFACYIALNSILGTKHFTKTNYDFILCRTFGYSKPDLIPNELKATPIFDKYTKRHHREKLLNQLELSWNILKYSTTAMRGFYIGKANKTNYQTIAEYDYKNRKSYKIEQLKQLKKVAYMNAKNK